LSETSAEELYKRLLGALPTAVHNGSNLREPLERHEAEKRPHILKRPTMNAMGPEAIHSTVKQTELTQKEEVGSKSVSQSANSKTPRILCPRCAGKKLEEHAVLGKRYLCRECGLAFNKPLKIRACPKCGLTDKIGRSTSKKRTNGFVWVRMKCGRCKATYLLHQELKNRRHKLRVYAYAIYHVLKGLSLESVRCGLKQFFGINVTIQTVRNWVREWILLITPHLLSLKLDCSGAIYLDEIKHSVEHTEDGWKWSEEFWQWNSWDPGKKTRLTVKLANSRNADAAYQAILNTLERVRMPDGGITFWCDRLSSYRIAYQRLVAEGKIDPNKVEMISVPKTVDYSVINEIEGVNMRWRQIVGEKLRISESLKDAEAKLQGEIVLHDFIEPRKEFNGKSAALNANANISFGANDTEAIVKLAQMLKAQKFQEYKVPPRKGAAAKSQNLNNSQETGKSSSSSAASHEN